MVMFTVTQVVDGDTFDVSPNWEWNGESGSRVRPAGYDAPELDEPGGQAAATWLRNLILYKKVELGKAYRVDRGRLVCEVYLKGKNLARYWKDRLALRSHLISW